MFYFHKVASSELFYESRPQKIKGEMKVKVWDKGMKKVKEQRSVAV